MNERRIELEGEIERMKQRLSYNIKRYRKLSRVSQQALADMCGLHRTYISDLENACGSPNGSDYEDEPESGKTGYYYYDTFTVSTTFDADGNEVVSGVW